MSTITATPYIELGKIDYNAGDVGGDFQASDSTSRRFVSELSDGTYRVVDIYAYVSDEFMAEDRDKEMRFYDVEAICFVTICLDPSDPGSTELAADVEREEKGTILPNGSTRKRAALLASRAYIKSLRADRL